MATNVRVRLTPGRINDFRCPEGKSQDFLRDTEQPGLALRATAAGGLGYVYEGKLAGRTFRMTLGDVKTLTLRDARDRAAKLRIQVLEGRDPRVVRAEKTAADLAARAKVIQEKGQSLKALLDAYCDYLEAQGRSSHKDARSIFRHHVVDAFPKLATKAAARVSPEEIADITRRLVEEGKGRTSNKCRSYVRAAYQLAKDARLKSSLPARFKEFGVTLNPAAETLPEGQFNRADKDPLAEDEMFAYWAAIRDLDGFRGAVLRLHLLTGAQRIAQLVRLKNSDIEADAIKIFDAKGRPGSEPRAHIVPLIPVARQALDAMANDGKYALSTDGGKVHLAPDSLSGWAQDVAREIIPAFVAKRLRSGVETLLSSRGVSRDTRGWLQSHGTSGVQARHYDAYDHMKEKRRALELLYRVLERGKGRVVPIREAA